MFPKFVKPIFVSIIFFVSCEIFLFIEISIGVEFVFVVEDVEEDVILLLLLLFVVIVDLVDDVIEFELKAFFLSDDV